MAFSILKEDFLVKISQDKEYSEDEIKQIKIEAEAKTKELIQARGSNKRRNTIYLNKLQEFLEKNELTEDFFCSQKKVIESVLRDIKIHDETILSIYGSTQIFQVSPEIFDKELDNQTNYNLNINKKLSEIGAAFKVSPPKNDSISASNNNELNESMVDAISKMSSSRNEVRPPALNCGYFDGATGNLEFNNFLVQFKNVIDCRQNLTNASKLTYLRGYLKGYALKIIQHLVISDDNYDVAMKLLKEEFLDIPFIIDEYLYKIIHEKPNFDIKYQETKVYINEMRSILFDLKGFGFDFMTKGSPGSVLVSHLIFSKLPTALRRELTHKVDSNYPDVSDIFAHYNDLIKTILRSAPINQKSNQNTFKSSLNNVARSNRNIKPEKRIETLPSLQNWKVNAAPSETKGNAVKNQYAKKPCRFCFLEGHPLYKCGKYTNVEDRTSRCKELNLCIFCASPRHGASNCPGAENKLNFECFYCKSRSHISAMCQKPIDANVRNFNTEPSVSNLCLNFNQESEKPFILPSLTIKFARGNNSTAVRCLIDTGSQRSYLSKGVVDRLGLSVDKMSKVNFDIKTFIGCQNRNLNETVLEIHMNPKHYIHMPLLIDDELKLRFEVAGMDSALYNIMHEDYLLADSGWINDLRSNNVVEMEGLIGTDIIQYFSKFNLVNVLNGSAFEVNEGLIPFGNVQQFLYSHQIRPRVFSKGIANVATNSAVPQLEAPLRVSSNEVDTSENHVNFVLDPSASYFSPLSHVLTESEVEHGLEQLFKLESIGISEESKLSSFDEIQIEKFKAGIELRDQQYFVDLPWNEDKIKMVPSNHSVALSVLNRVYASLTQKNLISEYQKVFDQQLNDGIIEKIVVTPNEYGKFVWIPHRPIVKMDQQVTTKVRPVFNCSLKVGDAPSLNDAAYTGIDLLSSLPRLLLQFRSNRYVMLSDVKQAFLQIKLKSEFDKNKFAFFWKEGNKLVSYRYKSIVFGFTSSPFILNYVIKHHVSKYSDDDCSKILRDNFYVDNLIISHDDVDHLKSIYQETTARMASGGFELRSWNSNSGHLQEIMKSDGRLVEHGSVEEKVLGYLYNTEQDTMTLSDFHLDVQANTKRKLLAQISKVFDPLSLYLPVTVRGRILMRDLWSLKLDWDEEVPADITKTWSMLFSDLNNLKLLSVPRSSVVKSEQNSLHVFCDASKSCYGFAVYAKCGLESNLIFSKAKVAPMKQRSLPSLELLSVFLAMKCLSTLLSGLSDIQFESVNIFVDAQIVLSWILSGDPKVKDIFVRNRIKDITNMTKEIKEKFGINICFNYVSTMENPADLLTRGLTFKEFSSKLELWLHGPNWISHQSDNWPKSPLLSLSEGSRQKTQTCLLATEAIATTAMPVPIIPIEKFSCTHKLHRITSYIFKFIYRARKMTGDPNEAARKYLINQMQHDSFSEEIKFLKETPKDKAVPSLIMQLNLFIDDQGILRSRGRISKTLLYQYDVLNPIMFGRNHHLTYLMIKDFHTRCQHLGIQTTINCIRTSGFWIPKARQTVKNVISHCIICKRFNNFAFSYPKMTAFDKGRMNFVKPFQHVGVDFTGHLWVKDPKTGTSMKMFILIYTCLNIRAIHLDLLPDMSSQSFLLSFQRFSNRYGIPSHIYSDNAKSFVVGGNILKNSLSTEMFVEHMRMNNIKHIKIPLYSAWIGSTWERLIRVVKSCMYKTVGRAKLSYYELLTSLSNIQNMVNSRPLTYRSSENDLDVISPNSFLKLHQGSNPILSHVNNDYQWDKNPHCQSELSQTLDKQEEAFENFKQIWYETYLLNLREQSRNLYQSDWTNRIAVNDIVLVKMPNKPRPFWLMGRVLEVILGFDNKIRSVKLKRGDGQVCHHSINHLYPLELSLTQTSNIGDQELIPEYSNSTDQTKNPQAKLKGASNAFTDEPKDNSLGRDNILSDQNTNDVSTFEKKRPVRKAALECRRVIKDNIENFV